MVNRGPEADAPPSDLYSLQVSRSLALCPSAYVIPPTSSHHIGMLASYIIAKRVRTAQRDSLRDERETTFTQVLLQYIVIMIHCYY